MRDVRRRERLAGLKRTSRQNRPQNDPKTVETKDENSIVVRASSQSPTASATLGVDANSLIPAIYQRGSSDKWSTGHPLPFHSTPNLPKTWFPDPFVTLSGTSKMNAVVSPLVYYCQLNPERAPPSRPDGA